MPKLFLVIVISLFSYFVPRLINVPATINKSVKRQFQGAKVSNETQNRVLKLSYGRVFYQLGSKGAYALLYDQTAVDRELLHTCI